MPSLPPRLQRACACLSGRDWSDEALIARQLGIDQRSAARYLRALARLGRAVQDPDRSGFWMACADEPRIAGGDAAGRSPSHPCLIAARERDRRRASAALEQARAELARTPGLGAWALARRLHLDPDWLRQVLHEAAARGTLIVQNGVFIDPDSAARAPLLEAWRAGQRDHVLDQLATHLSVVGRTLDELARRTHLARRVLRPLLHELVQQQRAVMLTTRGGPRWWKPARTLVTWLSIIALRPWTSAEESRILALGHDWTSIALDAHWLVSTGRGFRLTEQGHQLLADLPGVAGLVRPIAPSPAGNESIQAPP